MTEDTKGKLTAMLSIAAFGCLIFGILTIYNPLKARFTFQSTQGVVVDSRIERSNETYSSSDGRGGVKKSRLMYEPIVKYKYTVNRAQYEAEGGYDLQRAKFSDKEKAEKILSMFNSGETCTVYYNPKNPQNSTLNMDFPIAQSVMLGAGIILLVGLVKLRKLKT